MDVLKVFSIEDGGHLFRETIGFNCIIFCFYPLQI